MLEPQLFVCANGAVAVMLVNCSGPVPVLCTVMVLAALVVPTTCDGNDRLAGLTVTAGTVPVPFTVNACVDPRLPELSAIFRAPVTGPATEGLKMTETVQFDPAFNTEGQ